MKVFISADMEGVACVSSREEVPQGTLEYEPAQEQMTAELVGEQDVTFETKTYFEILRLLKFMTM